MSLYLMDQDKNRYDLLRASLVGTPIGTRRNIKQLAFAHGGVDIGDQKLAPRRLVVSTVLDGQTGGLIRLVDGFEAVGNWTAAYDGLTPQIKDASYIGQAVKQGTYVLRCKSDLDVDPLDTAQFQDQTTKRGDWSDYIASGYYLRLWVLFDSIDYLQTSDCFRIRFGSDSSNYYQYRRDKADFPLLTWTLLEFDLNDPETTNGSPDWTDVDYIQIMNYNTGDSAGNFNMYLDWMTVWRKTYRAEFDYFMRWIGETDLKLYKDSDRYINVESMNLRSHEHLTNYERSRGELELFCPDPFWYDEDETTEPTWTVTSSPDTEAVFNTGNVDVFPVIEITAGADLSGGIELKNETDGNALFTYIDSSFTSGKVLTVDCVDGTVDLDGTNTVRFFEGQFLRLLAGSNSLQYTDGNCSIVVKHRDRWI